VTFLNLHNGQKYETDARAPIEGLARKLAEAQLPDWLERTQTHSDLGSVFDWAHYSTVEATP
jgi:hypothetical protein